MNAWIKEFTAPGQTTAKEHLEKDINEYISSLHIPVRITCMTFLTSATMLVAFEDISNYGGHR